MNGWTAFFKVVAIILLYAIVVWSSIYTFANIQNTRIAIGGLITLVVSGGLAFVIAAWDEMKTLMAYIFCPRKGEVYREILPPRNPFDERDGEIREFGHAVVVEVLKGYVKFRIAYQLHLPILTNHFISPISEFHKKWSRVRDLKVVSNPDNPNQDIFVDKDWTNTIHYIHR